MGNLNEYWCLVAIRATENLVLEASFKTDVFYTRLKDVKPYVHISATTYTRNENEELTSNTIAVCNLDRFDINKNLYDILVDWFGSEEFWKDFEKRKDYLKGDFSLGEFKKDNDVRFTSKVCLKRNNIETYDECVLDYISAENGSIVMMKGINGNYIRINDVERFGKELFLMSVKDVFNESMRLMKSGELK